MGTSLDTSAAAPGEPPPQGLRKTSDFQALRSGGRAWNGPLMGVRTRRNTLAFTRVGFSVGKRVGKAVTRNRVKRRLRAIVQALPLLQGFDIAMSARPAAADATFLELQQAVANLLRRAQLLAAPGL